MLEVAINEYFNKGGKVTPEVEIINSMTFNNISDYENAIELFSRRSSEKY